VSRVLGRKPRTMIPGVQDPDTSPPKYISSDEELDSSDEEDEETLLNAMCKNPKERMKGLLKEIEIHDELLDQQEKLLLQERKLSRAQEVVEA
jgi:DNA segregation ATPase FtsK/SpoIIIE-like protein